MKKLFFINACIRENDSRTLKLAKRFLSSVSDRYEIEEADLCNCDLRPVDAKLYNRHKDIGFEEKAISFAKKFANADKIVIAAPFWDMSFPAALKVFFERITIFDITFGNLPDGNTFGMCKADRLLYITTRGMDLKTGDPLEQATPHIKALCYLWGIKNFDCLSVSGTDVLTENELQARFQAVYNEIDIASESF